MLTSFLPGFALSLTLIMAIGAQNAFVLRQGLRREHVLVVVLVCATSDAILITAFRRAGRSGTVVRVTDALRRRGLLAVVRLAQRRVGMARR